MAPNEIQDGDQKLSRKKTQTHTDTERQMVRERMEKTECTGE
jgi:hypothetical protein